MIKIAIDIDNVIVDFFNNFCEYCKQNSVNYSEDMREEALASGFNYRFDVRGVEFSSLFKRFTDEGRHYSSNLIDADMLRTFVRLFTGAPHSCFVTSRPLKTQVETIERLKNQEFADVLKDVPIFWSSDTYRKAEVIKDIGGITHFIDDQTAYLKEVKWANPEITTLWFNAYAMPSSVCPKDAIEMNSWTEVLDFLKL